MNKLINGDTFSGMGFDKLSSGQESLNIKLIYKND